MKEVDSQALGQVNRILQLQGAGAPITELEDGILGQSIDANPYIRRSLTVAGSGGLFGATLSTTHAAADDRTDSKDFYNLGAAFSQPPFPRPVGREWDIWVMTSSMRLSASAISVAGLFFDVPTLRQGPITIIGDLDVCLQSWSGTLPVGGVIFAKSSETGGIASSQRPVRIPRGVNLALIATSTAAVTMTCEMIVGLFPAGLGQDGSF